MLVWKARHIHLMQAVPSIVNPSFSNALCVPYCDWYVELTSVIFPTIMSRFFLLIVGPSIFQVVSVMCKACPGPVHDGSLSKAKQCLLITKHGRKFKQRKSTCKYFVSNFYLLQNSLLGNKITYSAMLSRYHTLHFI